MNGIRFQHLWWQATLAVVGVVMSWSPSMAALQNAGEADEGIEVLTRGPVHEAFAETVAFDPEPGIIVPRTPPAPIEELPPEQRPAGDNVEWIPGYWAWDEEREDFLWVSGLWRNLPPGREWVAGYWSPSRDGAQWTSGYWADAASTEREYLPEPPATAESGPNVPQPSPDYNWLPGSWTWQQNRYVWRPGFWAEGQPDWDWIPAHYQWTPRGYVYVEGYWDYAVERRGVLFSPVYFSPSVYGRPGFSYSPSLAINLAGFMNHLFLRPSYGHYYFGDYYAADYSTYGIYPWFTYGASGYGYDPFYARQRWRHRQDNQWAQKIEDDFQRRRDHDDARPPRTWNAERQLRSSGQPRDPGLSVATPYEELLKSQDNRTRFQPVEPVERERLGRRSREVQEFRNQRQKIETGAGAAQPDKERRPARVKLPKSPVVARPADQLGPDHVVPARHQAPEPDLKVEPKPRQPRGDARPRGKSQRESGADAPGAPPKKPQGASRRPQGGSQGKPGKKPKE